MHPMLIYTYDGTFEGLLTCIFEGFSRKRFPDTIHRIGKQPQNMFADTVAIHADSFKASRVWKGIQQKLTAKNKQLLYYAFLSEAEGIEIKIQHFAKRLFSENETIETDFGDSDVLEVVQNVRKVKKEAMRMLQFVRFQQIKDGIYFSGIDPIYDVLPLVLDHFRTRFADQQWLLYDLKRNYGAFYNKKSVEEVELTSSEIDRQTGKANENVLNEDDAIYQTLWKSYFEHINIKERKNLRLQRQHMPRRFWKYLTEKQ
jgi:probable DNA metabolism protein